MPPARDEEPPARSSSSVITHLKDRLEERVAHADDTARLEEPFHLLHVSLNPGGHLDTVGGGRGRHCNFFPKKHTGTELHGHAQTDFIPQPHAHTWGLDDPVCAWMPFGVTVTLRLISVWWRMRFWIVVMSLSLPIFWPAFPCMGRAPTGDAGHTASMQARRTAALMARVQPMARNVGAAVTMSCGRGPSGEVNKEAPGLIGNHEAAVGLTAGGVVRCAARGGLYSAVVDTRVAGK